MKFYEQEQERAARGWKIAFVASVLLNLVFGAYFLVGHTCRPDAEPRVVADVTPTVPTPTPTAAPTDAAMPDPAVVTPPPPPGELVPATPATAAATAPAVPVPASAAPAVAIPTAPAATPDPTYRTFCRKVTESLYGTFRAALPEKEAEWLSAYFARVMVWNIDIQRAVQKSDEIRVLYQMDGPPEKMVVPALEFRGTSGTVVRAVRYKAPGDAFPRYFDENGSEIEQRLRDSPIHDWEQITELFAGPRRHHGMDFKAPIGTPVYAPFAGRVVKKNWNWRANGNCLELEFPGKPFRAIFLHMDRIEEAIEAGTAVKAGQEIGHVGNTGHVTAPHLHYQLEIGDRPVDPMKQHATYRRVLTEAEKTAFRAATAPLVTRLAALTCP
jgi:murein DD-endopeptidase MepM/ murein hydrolase activator NlpD